MNLIGLIKQINSCRCIHRELRDQIEVGMKSRTAQIHPEGLYKKNEQQFYSLLRCKHEIDRYLGESAVALTVEEQTYFETLLEYTRALLKAIRLFPKLTYFLWQRSLGNFREPFYQNAFVTDWNRYQSFNLDATKLFRRVKQFN